jgi:hypothetical protein
MLGRDAGAPDLNTPIMKMNKHDANTSSYSIGLSGPAEVGLNGFADIDDSVARPPESRGARNNYQ